MFKVYCVTNGLNGLYMPNDVHYFTNKREMLSYIASEARELRYDGYKVSGSARSGGYVYGWADAYDTEAYALIWQVESFSTRAERDQFIADNQER